MGGVVGAREVEGVGGAGEVGGLQGVGYVVTVRGVIVTSKLFCVEHIHIHIFQPISERALLYTPNNQNSSNTFNYTMTHITHARTCLTHILLLASQ